MLGNYALVFWILDVFFLIFVCFFKSFLMVLCSVHFFERFGDFGGGKVNKFKDILLMN